MANDAGVPASSPTPSAALPPPATKETLLLPLRFLPSSTGRPEIVAAGDTVLPSLLSRATLSLSEKCKEHQKESKMQCHLTLYRHESCNIEMERTFLCKSSVVSRELRI